MKDGFGRKIDYLRISVTDRCNFRCHYCMPEHQKFLPRTELLDYAELALISDRFIHHGIRKIRLTGGEPLVRRDIDVLLAHLGRHVASGNLDELTLTTNGSRLLDFAGKLVDANVRRINVSLDSLNPDNFQKITRGGRLKEVLSGLAAAKSAGISIRINMVALKNENEAELLPMVEFCAKNGFDLALIETMPLGQSIAERTDQYISLENFTAILRQKHELVPLEHRTAGPARYWKLSGLDLRLGLITPLSNNFCDGCNRLRLTTDGKIYMCLGSDLHVDLRSAIREDGTAGVDRILQTALKLKPEKHDFEHQMQNANLRLNRHMNATGG